jgi:hypothetical protein
MSNSRQLIGTILALCCALAAAAASPALSPLAGSDAVRALRAQPEGELQLQYLKQTPNRAPETYAVRIARDYLDVADSATRWLIDFPLRRVFTIRPGNAFVNDSLYADAWWRVMELKNRALMRKLLQAGGQTDPAGSVDPFWAETELGVALPEFPRPNLQRSEKGGRIRWMLNGEEVAAVRYDAEPVPESIRAHLRRFWAGPIQVHPDIADQLAASGRIAQEIWVTAKRGKDPVVTHWKLTARHWEPAAHYPLPAQLTALPTISDGAFPEIFALLSKDVADRKVPPAPEVYAARADAAIMRGAGLEAVLWIMEMSLAEGRAPDACNAGDPRLFCSLLARAGPLLKSDPRGAAAFAKQSPDQADRPQFDSLPNGYLLRLLWATRPPGKGVEYGERERDLLAAAQASPIANFCKDTGDFYAAAWKGFPAWQVWDLGRLMAGHTADDLLHQVDVLEDQLLANEPGLF